MRIPRAWFISVFALAVLVSRTSSAQQAAQGRGGVGVGAEATTTGIVGGTFVYDAVAFHVDALLGASFTSGASEVAAAARLFFPLHRSSSADFSIGPGLGLVHATTSPAGAPRQARNEVHAEGAVQIRAFIVPNVALSASAGIGAVFRNGGNRAVIGGQVGGSLGVTYFFF